MSHQELRYPSTWEERKPYLLERALFVPDYYAHHDTFSMPDWKEVFGNDNPLYAEFCSGNGEWIAEWAQKNPHINWIAVEWDFQRARQIYKRMQTLGLSNLFVAVGEGLTFSRFYLKKASLDAIFVNFPDPWPKERHAKHRIIQTPFADEAERTLKKGGCVTMVTDAFPYAEQMVTTFQEHSAFTALFPEPFYVTEWADYGASYFGTLWRKKGLNIHYIKFEKHADD